MIHSSVSNAIMNCSRLSDIDNSQNDIDSSFIETPGVHVIESPRRPLARINDINTHQNQFRGDRGIHSGPMRVPMKEKALGKVVRTPTTGKKQTQAGYLATTEAYRNSVHADSPVRIPLRSPSATPSRTKSPARPISSPPSSKRASRHTLASTSGHSTGHVSGHPGGQTPTSAPSGHTPSHTGREHEKKRSLSAGHSSVLKCSNHHTCSTGVISVANIAAGSASKTNLSTPVKPSYHTAKQSHYLPGDVPYRSPAAAAMLHTHTPRATTTDSSTPPVSTRSQHGSGSGGGLRRTSSGGVIAASPMRNTPSSPASDVFARLTVGLPTRHTAPAVPMTRAKKLVTTGTPVAAGTPSSSERRAERSRRRSSNSSATKKSRIPVSAGSTVGSGGSSVGRAKTNGSHRSSSGHTSTKTTQPSGGKTTSVAYGTRASHSHPVATANNKDNEGIVKSYSLGDSGVATGAANGGCSSSCQRSSTRSVQSKSLLRVSNASQTSWPPSIHPRASSATAITGAAYVVGNGSATTADSNLHGCYDDTESAGLDRNGFSGLTNSISCNSSRTERQVWLGAPTSRLYPHPPASLDFTLSDSSFAFTQCISGDTIRTNRCSDGVHGDGQTAAAAAAAAFSRNTSSADWCVSPICRTESTTDFTTSYCNTTQEQQPHQPVHATSPSPRTLGGGINTDVDQNVTNDSDLTMTTVGSMQNLHIPPPPAMAVIARPQAIPMQHIQAILQRQKQQRGVTSRNVVVGGIGITTIGTATTDSHPAGHLISHRTAAGATSAVIADPFPDEVSVVEPDESRSSSPRSLMSGSCWTQASEMTRTMPTADSQSYDETFFHDFVGRPSSSAPRLAGGSNTSSDLKIAGPVRKTYMGHDLQKEVSSSKSASLGCGMFEMKATTVNEEMTRGAPPNDCSEMNDDMSIDTLPIQEALGNVGHDNTSSSTTVADLAPAVCRTNSYVYGATDEDGLTIDTGFSRSDLLSDALNKGMMRGSSFSSWMSTASSLSSMSMLSSVTPVVGSTWSVFSPRGEVKSRLPTPNPSQNFAQSVDVGPRGTKITDGRVVPVWEDETAGDLNGDARSLNADGIDISSFNNSDWAEDYAASLSADGAAGCKIDDDDVAEPEPDDSFSLSRQNSFGEIVENHDSSLEGPADDDFAGDEFDGNGANDDGNPGTACVSVEKESMISRLPQLQPDSKQCRPSGITTAAMLHDLRVATDGDVMGNMETSEVSDLSGANLYLAPLSTRESDGTVVFPGPTPQSSTLSVLNKGFCFVDIGKEAEDNDAVCCGGDDYDAEDDGGNDASLLDDIGGASSVDNMGTNQEGGNLVAMDTTGFVADVSDTNDDNNDDNAEDVAEVSDEFELGCFLHQTGHGLSLSSCSPAPVDNFGGFRHTVDDPMASLLLSKASFVEEDEGS